MEKGLHVNTTILISVKFQKCGGTEEVSELQRKLGSNSEEGVVI
jgi:hypothetical protein